MPPLPREGWDHLSALNWNLLFFIQSIQVSDVAYESHVTSIYVVHAHVAHTGIFNCMKTKAIQTYQIKLWFATVQLLSTHIYYCKLNISIINSFHCISLFCRIWRMTSLLWFWTWKHWITDTSSCTKRICQIEFTQGTRK